VEQVLEAGCAFINAIPVFIASSEYWGQRFKEHGLPIIGDDIKSQVGATILHRVLTSLFVDRGVRIDRTYQLNTGGNTDFLNMLERERLYSKKISKTNAVTSQIKARGLSIEPENVHVGPSDYVPWQKDNKLCFLRIESRHFGDIPTYLDCRLSVEDSPNSAGVVIDAIRCCKLALNNGVSGALFGPASYFMKSPPRQYTDTEAKDLTERFIIRYGKKEAKRKARKKAAPKKK
jgi:myo-inositol-1-phosphate synthase